MSRSLALLLALTAGWGASIASGARAVEMPAPVPATSAAIRPQVGITPPVVGTPAPAAPASSTSAAVTSTREIVLELGKRTISLRENGRVLGSWPVAIGDPATPTPTGHYRIRNKVINPQYQSTKSGKVNQTQGAQGPLGDRWMGFHATEKDQYGIHGTPSAWAWTVTSRSAVTHGCVRMLTPHVRALFDQVEIGTPVVVTP
ncbi:MAG: hypothetical protein ER33_00445 [Cyanobium sp. CACIAM 14]|nr:MAG: hypothetical protein ER33_00445 [Cyanobium sp. CACIAM 14]